MSLGIGVLVGTENPPLPSQTVSKGNRQGRRGQGPGTGDGVGGRGTDRDGKGYTPCPGVRNPESRVRREGPGRSWDTHKQGHTDSVVYLVLHDSDMRTRGASLPICLCTYLAARRPPVASDGS